MLAPIPHISKFAHKCENKYNMTGKNKYRQVDSKKFGQTLENDKSHYNK